MEAELPSRTRCEMPLQLHAAASALYVGKSSSTSNTGPPEMTTPQTIDQIRSDFELLDDWEDRYRYVIELGRMLAPLPDSLRNDANKVRGCASQVWLATTVTDGPGSGTRLTFLGDSDAHIVRGLIAILLAVHSGHTAAEILSTDAQAIFGSIGLNEHLTPQRSNGLASMMTRIRADAQKVALAAN